MGHKAYRPASTQAHKGQIIWLAKLEGDLALTIWAKNTHRMGPIWKLSSWLKAGRRQWSSEKIIKILLIEGMIKPVPKDKHKWENIGNERINHVLISKLLWNWDANDPRLSAS